MLYQKLFFASLLFSFGLSTCKPYEYHDPRLGGTDIAPPSDSELCKDAEENLTYTCPAVAKPTAKGTTFTQWCKEFQTKGVSLSVKCLVTVRSCEEADACLQH